MQRLACKLKCLLNTKALNKMCTAVYTAFKYLKLKRRVKRLQLEFQFPWGKNDPKSFLQTLFSLKSIFVVFFFVCAVYKLQHTAFR